MSSRPRFLVVLPLLCAALIFLPLSSRAQDINFDQIDKFESFGTGTLDVGSSPKTIIDDDERHTLILTVWEADAQTKVYWKSLDGAPQTTVMPGRGVQTFQTAGEFKLEAVGDPYHQVKYGYVLLRLKKQ
jgi:hypothetical protein